MSSEIKKILKDNQIFVKNQGYLPFQTDKYPQRKLAILTCMDTRLSELLPAALGIQNGEVKLIRNAGGIIVHPYGSAIRSLLIAVYSLNVTDIMVIAHTDCGVQHLNEVEIMNAMMARGIQPDALQEASSQINLSEWLSGFEDVFEAVNDSVQIIKQHPLFPSDIHVSGYVMNTETGELMPVKQ